MAKKSNSTRSVAGSANRRRSAAKTTALETDDVFTKKEMEEDKDENESNSESEEKVQLKPNRKRGVTNSLPATELRRSKRVKSDNALKEDEQLKYEQDESKKTEKKGKKGKKKTVEIKHEASPEQHPTSPQIKTEADDSDIITTTATQTSPHSLKTATATAAATLQAKKLKSYTQFAGTRQTPYPTFPRPSPSDCKQAHAILASLHGAHIQPATTPTTAPTTRAGCGDSPSVLDALIRTILSQNTSSANSTRAKLSMDLTYGSSSAWPVIASGGRDKLAAAIACGGLAGIKSRVILDVLAQTKEKYGAYSLDHLFARSDEDAMRELIGFKGVGPKTASCVLLFCLRRASFAVDTHVYRITGLLGWRPPGASRDQTYAHLDARIPDEDKYGLHVLLVKHGRECEECRAGGKSLGRCELRKAFRKGKVEGEEVKGEEEEVKMMKAEEDGGEDDDVKG